MSSNIKAPPSGKNVHSKDRPKLSIGDLLTFIAYHSLVFSYSREFDSVATEAFPGEVCYKRRQNINQLKSKIYYKCKCRLHANWSGLGCIGRYKKNRQGKVYNYAYISPVWGAAPNEPIVSIFGKFSGFVDIIKYAKFHNDR